LWPSSSFVPRDLVLIEVKLRDSIGDAVEQDDAVGVGTIHSPQSERCSGRNGESLLPQPDGFEGFATIHEALDAAHTPTVKLEENRGLGFDLHAATTALATFVLKD
jgi:hypothetical protein